MSNKRLGIGETISVFFALTGLGIQLRWPEQKWLGTVFIITGIACAIGMLIWVIAQRVALKQAWADSPVQRQIEQRQIVRVPVNNSNTFEPHNTFAPVINVGQSQSQPQAQTLARPRTSGSPSVFEATDNSRLVRCGFDGSTLHLIREQYFGDEKDLPEHIAIINAALAQFYYRPDVGVEPYLNVIAHVFVYNPEGKRLDPVVYDTVWDNEDYDRIITFYSGRAHNLIVGLIKEENPDSLVLYEYATKEIPTYIGNEQEFAPNVHRLEGSKFYIRVEIIPKRVNDPLPTQEFWFQLDLGSEPRFMRSGTPIFALGPRL